MAYHRLGGNEWEMRNIDNTVPIYDSLIIFIAVL